MKLATLKDGTRDGQLVVVSRDLHTAAIADAIAPTLQRVVEDWSFYAPQLRALYDLLNHGRARRAFGFDPKHCMAPLPRAYRLLGHDEEVEATHAEAAAAVRAPRKNAKQSTVAVVLAGTATRLAARRADQLLGAHDDIVVAGTRAALDFRAGLAAILSDVPPGTLPAGAADHVRLLMLSSAFATPADAPETSTRLDWCGFSPVAVTPDELGDAWQGGKLSRLLDVQINGRRATRDVAGLAADFSLLVASAAREQRIVAGTVLASGPASHLSRNGVQPLLPLTSETDVPASSDVAEAEVSAAIVPSPMPTGLATWLGFGDRVRIDLLDKNGESICGAIEQTLAGMDDDSTD